MKILNRWSDEDTTEVALFDDGVRAMQDERGAALIRPNGDLLMSWWRIEPEDNSHTVYFDMMAEHDGAPARLTPEMETLIHEIVRKGSANIFTKADELRLIELTTMTPIQRIDLVRERIWSAFETLHGSGPADAFLGEDRFIRLDDRVSLLLDELETAFQTAKETK